MQSQVMLPLKMHSLRKSGNDIWSLRTAWVLVMKFLAWPEVPAQFVSGSSQPDTKVPIPFFLILPMVM